MKIGGLQKVSLIDYPGHVSAIVFTQGCNFRCPYCHNPELVDPLRYRECVEEKEIISFLLKRQGKLDAVSLSGGEPTLQSGVITFLRRLKDMGYLVKVDTNGSRPDILEKMIEEGLLDYIAMDIKAPLEKYPTIVRSEVNPDSINRSIALVRSSGLAYEFRTTLVKALLGLDDILQIAKWISPARRYVLQGFVRSEVLDERLLNESPPSPDELEKIKKTIEKYLHSIWIR
jgi:pyruvate formate lyase activating enzyme